MILLFHIFVAVGSLAQVALAYVQPSKTKLYIAYVLVALMLISGIYLTISKPVHLTQTCISGLVYLLVIFFGMSKVHHKLKQL